MITFTNNFLNKYPEMTNFILISRFSRPLMLESLVRSNREQLFLIEQQAGYCNDGSKDCCINNLTLLSIILIYSTVKDLVLSHFDLVRDLHCFLNHKLVFKFWTQCQIKMTHKLIK
jgi:hypothetical protein